MKKRPLRSFLSIFWMKCLISVHCVTRASPVVKDFIFSLPLTSFFTCRNHCNICKGYEFFCHKKGHKYPWGMKNHWKGRKITALVFIFQVKLVLHLLTHVFNTWLRKIYICMKVISDLYSIFKEMTHFELSQKHILIQKLVLFIREPPILKLRQNKSQTFVFESTACCKKKKGFKKWASQ